MTQPGTTRGGKEKSGKLMMIYGRSAGLRSFYIGGTNWKVCTEIADCASDMHGVTGAELLIALPSEVRIVSLQSGTTNSYWIGSQYDTFPGDQCVDGWTSASSPRGEADVWRT